MILYSKLTKKDEMIYGIKSDNHGYPLFLIRYKNQWVWRSAKHFIPKEDETINVA